MIDIKVDPQAILTLKGGDEKYLQFPDGAYTHDRQLPDFSDESLDKIMLAIVPHVGATQ
jgi:hypothetical protein